MITDPLDVAFKILQDDNSVPHHDQLPQGEGYLQVRTLMQPISILFNGKRPDYVFYPPQQSFKIHVIEKDDQTATKKILTMLIKMRNYLAFPVGVEVGFAYILNSRSTYWNAHMSGGASSGFLGGNDFYTQIREPEKYEKQWEERAKSLWAYLDDFLEKIKTGSTLDDVVSLMGKSTLIGDMEQAFVVQWNAVDLLSRRHYNDQVESYKKGQTKALDPYLALIAKKMASGGDVKLMASDKIFALAKAMDFDIDSKRLDEFRRLRNKIIHETIEDSKILDNSSIYQEFYKIARNLTFKALIGEGVKVPHSLI